MINFCVGTSFKHLELVDHADKCNQKGKGVIKDFYGSVQNEIFSSINFGDDKEHSNFRDLEIFIKKANMYGMKIYITLNTLRGTPDFVDKNRKGITDFFGRLENIGTEGIILTSVPLIELAAKETKNLKLSVSAILQLDNLQNIKRFQEMGADRIILSLFRGRDFNLLEKLGAVPGMEWEILCNEICRFDCPFLQQHYLHRSNPDFAQDKTHNYYYKFCFKELLEDFPLNILKTRFIRPEDVPFYHDFFGIQYFKIVRRETQPEIMKHYMDAYTSLSYDGNLMDLFPMFIKKPSQLHSKRYYLPNKTLCGFLNYFYTKRPDCFNDCFTVGGQCDYCLHYATENLLSGNSYKIAKS